MQEAARREAIAQAADQFVSLGALGGPDGCRVPFGAFEIVDGNEGWFAAHGKADVLGAEIFVDPVAERIEGRPGLI